MKKLQENDSNEKSKRRIKWRLWLIMAGVAALLTLMLVKLNSGKVFPYKGDYPDAVTVELLDEEGNPYTVDAIAGQICVWFDSSVSYREAKKAISKSGGKIVAQIPGIGYYLVEVPPHETRDFLSKMHGTDGTEWAFLNMVSYPSEANTYILDNYYPRRSNAEDTTPHGVMVQFALEQVSADSPSKAYNIGTKNGKSMCVSDDKDAMCTNNAVFAINEIASSAIDGPIIINMSFGPYLRKREDSVRYYWGSATDEEKQDYQQRFLRNMRNIIQAVKPLSGKDYVVTKSAGNNGVKVFDAAIITYLQENLEPEEIEVLDKHFLIVTAGETMKENKHYSNEMENGHYSPWVTKVDISDFQYNGKRKFGTSFAAPRAAGILSAVANEMNLTGAEVLQLAKEVTKQNHVLTKEALLQAAKEKSSSTTDDPYMQNGCLEYRLVYNETTDEELLELHNTCDENIRVEGTLLNAIAPHGGENTLDFETIVRANGTEYVEGFLENKCTIKNVEKISGKSQKGKKGHTFTCCTDVSFVIPEPGETKVPEVFFVDLVSKCAPDRIISREECSFRSFVLISYAWDFGEYGRGKIFNMTNEFKSYQVVYTDEDGQTETQMIEVNPRTFSRLMPNIKVTVFNVSER